MRLVALQLETCHANTNGTAWYAYVEGEGTPSQAQSLAGEAYQGHDADRVENAPLSAEFVADPEEVPNALSRHTGLRRYYVAAAV